MNYSDFDIPIKSLKTICRVCLVQSEVLISIDEIYLTHSYRNGFVVEINVRDVFNKYCNIQILSGSDNFKPNNMCESCMNMVCTAYNLFEQFVESNAILDSLNQKQKLEAASLEAIMQDQLHADTEGLTSAELIMDHIISSEELKARRDKEYMYTKLHSEYLKDRGDKGIMLIPENKESETKTEQSLKGILVNTEMGSNHEEFDDMSDSCTFTSDEEYSFKTDDGEDSLKSDSESCKNHDFNNKNAEFIMLVPEDKKISIGAMQELIDVLDNGEMESVHKKYENETDIDPVSIKEEEYPHKIEDLPMQPVEEIRNVWWDHSYSLLNAVNSTQVKLKSSRKLENIMKPALDEPKKHTNTFGADTFHCNVCDNAPLRGMEEVIEHIKEVHPSSKRCILCPKELLRSENVVIHVASHSNSGKLVCRKCLLYFKDIPSLQRHKASQEHKAPFSCESCSKLFKTRYAWKAHNQELHLKQGKELFQCWICGLVLKWARNYKAHLKTHKNVPKSETHLCEFCAKGFFNASNLKAHVLKIHKERDSPKRIYSCEFCPKTFTSAGSFFTHRISHPECKSVNCLFCDKVFSNAKEYREHKRADHNAFVCDICKRGFPTKLFLANHKYLHTTNYKCSYCDASFKTRQACTKHEYIHTDEKPYQCQYCKKRFKQQAHVNQHVEALHTEKRFKCNQCDKGFVFDSAYRNHLRTHTGKKPFICPYCGKNFRDTSTRHKHVKRDHPEQMDEFLLFKKTHQEDEIKLADSQSDIPEDTDTAMQNILLYEKSSYNNIFSQEEILLKAEEDQIIDFAE